MTGKRSTRPRHAPLKVGTEVKLKKDETLRSLSGTGFVPDYIRFRAGTTGRVVKPWSPFNGNPVIEIFLLDKGRQNYEVTRSNVRVVAKAKPKKKPASNLAPKGFGFLTPLERNMLKPIPAKRLVQSLKNQRKAKKDMLEVIQAYADCTANVSHARRIAYRTSGLT